MAGQEYKGREKVVQKMSRDGLTEENLHDGSVHNVSNEPRRDIREKSSDISLERKSAREDIAEENTSGRNKKYQNARELVREPPTRAAPEEGAEGLEADEAGTSEYSSKRQKLNQFRRYADIGHKSDNDMRDTPLKTADKGSSYRRKLRDSEKIPEEETLGSKEAIQKKRQRSRLTEEQKKVSKLSFDDEGGLIPGAGAGIGRKAVGTGTMVAGGLIHGKLKDAEDDNAAVEGAHASEIAAEEAAKSLRSAQARSNRTSGRLARRGYRESEIPSEGRLKFGEADPKVEAAKEAAKKKEQRKEMNKFWQRKRYKDSYIAARRGKKVGDATGTAGSAVAESFTEKAKRATEEIFRKNKAIFIGIGVFALLFMLISASLTSCSTSIQGAGSVIGMTTYPSTDEDIRAAENAYSALETSLNQQINTIESRNPGYDEYRYNVAEISHNPYHLISFLTVKYGEFKYEDVEQIIKDLFAMQYGLTTESSTETVTETRTVRVGESLGQVVTSGYCNCRICCGQWSGGPTASGAMPQANHTIAVDAHNPTVPMGTHVVMNGVEYVVEDTGAFDRYGVDFDVYYDSHSAASAHGHKTWEAFLADSNGSNEVTVTNTTTKRILTVTLTNASFDAIARANLDDEEMILYNALNTTLGNRDYLFDVSTIPAGGDGMSYDIPPEALSDQRFANMIREAEKYLGYPYVWGGASPSTSFDCSGYVSWVVNHCGNGWNYGRLTADGLRSVCTYVPPNQAKPGDLIFFEKTYNTSGASHVGIYVGNGMMIHCGDPIHYSNINTAYWQQHFLCFGRLP